VTATRRFPVFDGRFRFLVALVPVRDLRVYAEHLFGAAKGRAVRPVHKSTYRVGCLALEGAKSRSQTLTRVRSWSGIQGRLRNRRCSHLARTA
jgi:hypothetical protein